MRARFTRRIYQLKLMICDIYNIYIIINSVIKLLEPKLVSSHRAPVAREEGHLGSVGLNVEATYSSSCSLAL